MDKRKGLINISAGKFQVVRDMDIPMLKSDRMLCRVAAVALNPADAKISDYSPAPGSIGGFDFSGEIVEIGCGVTRFKIGDRVFGIAHGYNPDDTTTGAFSDYVLATEDLACKIPPSMGFEEASTFSIAFGTAGCVLYDYFGFSMPQTDQVISPARGSASYVLVSGGATSTGMAAIQLLKLSGLKPIATCSSKSRDMVKSLGAIETFDYHSPNCGIDIKNYTDDNLTYAMDCISSAETMSMCYKAIGSSGGKYIALDPISTHVKYTRRDVHADWVMGVSVFGCAVKFSGVYGRPEIPEHRQLAAQLFAKVETLISNGMLRSPAFQVRHGSLDAVAAGIEDVRNGNFSGGKIVYLLSEQAS